MRELCYMIRNAQQASHICLTSQPIYYQLSSAFSLNKWTLKEMERFRRSQCMAAINNCRKVCRPMNLGAMAIGSDPWGAYRRSNNVLQGFIILLTNLQGIWTLKPWIYTIAWNWTADGIYNIKSAYNIQVSGSVCKFKENLVWRDQEENELVQVFHVAPCAKQNQHVGCSHEKWMDGWLVNSII